jgi:hypothetical protein
MRRASLVAAVLLIAGCTSLLGPRREDADLGAPDGAIDLAGEDLAGQDLAGQDLAGHDLAGEDLASQDLKMPPDFSGVDGPVAGVPSAANSSIQINPGMVTADGSSNAIISVTVRDGFNNVVNGEPVMLSATGSNQTLTPSSGITNSFGVFNATLSSTKAELKTVTATVSGFMLQAQVQFVAGNPLAGDSSLTVSPGTIPADGTTATITVTLKDMNGNPVSGQAVTLTATGMNNTLTPSSGNTDASGTFTATISSTKAEQKTITATVGSFMLNQMLTVTPGTPSASTSTVTAAPTSNVLANGSNASTVTVTVRDANSNVVSGVNVTLSATGGGTTFTPSSGSTNGSGVLTSALTSTASGTKTITAVAGGVTITSSMPMVSFVACPTPTTLTVGAAPVSGNTTSGGNVYHPKCAVPSDSTESVYGFSLGSASSVIIDRSSSFAGGLTDLRPGSMCTTDSMSFGCSTNRYLYCPNLIAGSYELVVDGISGAAGSFNLAVTAPGTTKGAVSYGVVTLPASYNTIKGVAGASDIIPNTVTNAGNATATVSLPFSFQYFNTTYPAGTTLTIYQQGYVSFDVGVVNNPYNNSCPLSSSALAPPDTIEPFWTWLTARTAADTDPRGDVYVATQGVAPNRTFTVEWYHMDGTPPSNTAFFESINTSVQVILSESTNQIEFHYQPVAENVYGANTTFDKNYSVGSLATIGLRSGSSTVFAEQESCISGAPVIGTCASGNNNNLCTANKAYLFVPKDPACP